MTEKEKTFHCLHHNTGILLLPNIWDPLGALLLQDLGYPAVATSSAAIALSNGYPDGEQLPFEMLLSILKRIVSAVSIPVTADVERGYASNSAQLKEHIKMLIDTGIAGINYEDSIPGNGEMVDLKDQCEKIELIKRTASECGSDLFVNARIDVYIKAPYLNDEEKLSAALKRGKAYKEAGADGLYPIILKDAKHMEAIVRETRLPINVTLLPGNSDIAILKNTGIKRISLASGFLKMAVTAMHSIAEKLLHHEDIQNDMNKMITSDYLSNLIRSK